jgi:NADPH-dependent 2,4-dienoyl-CoA reductase/sulfur reductase-like enzyme/peroxiredoxin family protein/rhodanese-related sulfurtransferase/TusA-related sulfurtransferase
MATYVIVGGVAGGASAAARLRRKDESAEIIVLERGAYVLFANCGLPYHIGGVIAQRDALLVSTPEKLCAEFAIDVRTEHEVTRIDRAARGVEVRDLRTGRVYHQPYDRLILSPGAKPLVPRIPGVDLPGVYTLRSMRDMDAIKEPLDAGRVSSAVVVGGGFIGLEMAENLRERGVTVTLVEMLPQVMAPLDYEMAAMLHRELAEHGVRLILGDGLQAIAAARGRLTATLASGAAIDADMVVLAIGVQPESDLAREAGLELGPKGHIRVDAHLRTSDPAIYAVGDAIEVVHPILQAPTAVPLAGPANRQARIAADHITGADVGYRGTYGTAIVKVFGLTAALTGTNSRALEQQGIAFLTSITHSPDHVTYYPGAAPQTLKLLYRPDDGRLLGAQVVGRQAVDRTIHTLATALQAGMTVYDLEHLELAYAPPYGAAKDPVNIAGYVAANRLRGDTELVEWSRVQELVAGDMEGGAYGILDVRSEPEWALGHIPGALHIPNTELRSRLDALDRSKTWIVYCKVGRRAYVMERMLRQHGFRVQNLSGGWDIYALASAAQGAHAAASEAPAGECPVPRAAHGANGRQHAGTGNGSNGHAPTATPMPAAVEAAARLNAVGLQCPGPILAVYHQMQGMESGAVLEVQASDPGFGRDVTAWAESTGNPLLDLREEAGTIIARLQKGAPALAIAPTPQAATAPAKTMVVFSGDLDHALASFVIANGAAAMGQRVTMFFTFWGLNVLRRREAPPVPKNLVERLLGWMLPREADALSLSRLHMGGAGTWMIKRVMSSKRIDSLPRLIGTARENGVRLIACQMSMDMMGIRPEELIDGVEVGGVATFIAETDKANATLFI